MEGGLVASMFVIFTGGAVLATLALFARQALPVAYIALGLVAGPWGLAWVDDPALIGRIADIGILFLLFLLGLDMQPQDLLHLLGKATAVTLGSSLAFLGLGAGAALAFGLAAGEAAVVGAAFMFSSTIIGLKLMPTTTLHHRHTGELVIAVLLLQDLLAIAVLILLEGLGGGAAVLLRIGLGLPALAAAAFAMQRWVLLPLLRRFDTIQEYVFLLAIGWCLGGAELAALLGLSHEIGAFIAGVALASSPIALFIAERLKPLRDFFLVLFFFSLGAGYDLGLLPRALPLGLALALLAVAAKPLVFALLLRRIGEPRGRSREVGIRLGQMSEFALLISVAAAGGGALAPLSASALQLATLLSLVLSSYVIVLRYPSPIAVDDRLRRD
ncbi:cation:proton antiporter [Inmirania thermothiophila]|uniref:Transporter (CPA2 family) n=1 Tax=Inmirania thermothiophila TaxID=1750597 RepID=A0A3N1Y750_9GAMM|nr:cation:proton antiporter [Inmirania thermothiophila]ROR34348.1 transporter (CPA2 family) [Inmirania thermothiophila]